MNTKPQIDAISTHELNHPQLKLIPVTLLIVMAIVFSGPLYSQNIPEAPYMVTATPTAVCPSSPYVYLKAKSPGNSIRWYTVSSGGTPIGTTASGASLNVNVTQPTSYFAESVTPAHVSSMTRTIVTVGVNTAPVISFMPADINTNNTPGQCGRIVTYPSAVATGTPTPSIIYSDASGSNFASGNTNVIVTAVNTCGTTSSAFDVTVNDIESPTITAPANMSIVAPLGVNSISRVFLGTPAASDNCGILATYNDAPAVFPVGITNVTWTTTDYNNNTSYSTQVVNVQLNNLAPVFDSPTKSTGGSSASNAPASLNGAYKVVNYADKKVALQASVYPNPFTSNLTININSTSSEKVEVNIYNPLGRQVASTLQAEPNTPLTMNNNLSPGIYYVRATQAGQTQVMKVIKN